MVARHAVLLTPSKSSAPPQLLSCKHPAHESPQIPFFVFKRLRTLSFSVSSKSFACHSYENSRVCTNNSQTGTRHWPLISRYCTQALSFHILTHSFARLEMSTPLFSSTPALFAKNTGGGVRGTFLRIQRGMRTPRSAAPSVVCESRLVETRGLSNFVPQMSCAALRAPSPLRVPAVGAFPAPARSGPAPSQRANEVFREDLRLFRQRARARPIAAADRSFRLLDEAANLGYKVRLRRCELAPFRASQIPLGNCQAVLRLLLGLGHIFRRELRHKHGLRAAAGFSGPRRHAVGDQPQRRLRNRRAQIRGRLSVECGRNLGWETRVDEHGRCPGKRMRPALGATCQGEQQNANRQAQAAMRQRKFSSVSRVPQHF